MTAALLGALIPVAYIAVALLLARWRYAAIRPYTEPLSCTAPYHTYRKDHRDLCYARKEMITTAGEAVVFSLLYGLAWPFFLPAFVVTGIVTSGDRVLPEELQAQIKRLEKEAEQLKRETS